MWYQVFDAHDDKPLGMPHLTIGAALYDCARIGFNTEIRGVDVGKIHASFVAGILVGGTPDAIEGCYARGIEVQDEGR